jgi:indole-3-glycerol phosphate synthase
VAVIAEVKRRSPSKGDIAPGLSAAERAAAYAAGGAVALSILTEPSRFGGSDADLRTARLATRIPLLKKDFHVAPVQVLEARALGPPRCCSSREPSAGAPDGARAPWPTPSGSRRWSRSATSASSRRPLVAGATVVGVNNRNLETLAIDLAPPTRSFRSSPGTAGRVVFESGVHGPPRWSSRRAGAERGARGLERERVAPDPDGGGAPPHRGGRVWAALRTVRAGRRREG